MERIRTAPATAPAARSMPPRMRDASQGSWRSPSTCSTSSGSSAPACWSPSSLPTSTAARRAHAWTATRWSSSGRSWGAPDTSTAATPSPPGTTLASTPPSTTLAGSATGYSPDSMPTRTRATSSTASARTSWRTRASRWASSTKPQVRDLARRHGLATADKPESQEVCFVREGDYRAELQKRDRLAAHPGATGRCRRQPRRRACRRTGLHHRAAQRPRCRPR